ncbi:MAG: hypothetical protein ABH951_01985, partial [Patescibacteria group bacterium]
TLNYYHDEELEPAFQEIQGGKEKVTFFLPKTKQKVRLERISSLSSLIKKNEIRRYKGCRVIKLDVPQSKKKVWERRRDKEL